MAEDDFREDSIDLQDQAQLRDWVTDVHLPEAVGGDQRGLRAMRLLVKAADMIEIELDGDGQVEWLVFKFDEIDYAWSPDDGWDDVSPMDVALCRMDDALKAALDLAGLPK